ncbi:hypothetical protein PVK06_001639 [Gossypium arboreum]|uniref:Uncharacterized protein n=1 Tax=Gossypium arboreum TaxID=29729 RepID=A0ABR0R2V1_GOSAR|nr:hypothetical protein PVK06_001639 [Gossypium arboreum]
MHVLRYDIFDVNGELQLEMVISSYDLRGNAVMELYIKFVEADRSNPSSITITTNIGTEVEIEIPTTWFCGGFTGLLQSSYYDVPETSMARHSGKGRSIEVMQVL